MKKILFTLLISLSFTYTFAQNFRTPQEVLRAVSQKTGWDKWQTVRSLKVTSEVASLQKTEINVYKLPNYAYSYTSSLNNSVRVTEVKTPQKAWRIETNGRKSQLRGASSEKIFPVQELNLLNATGLRLTQQNLNGKPMYVIAKPAGSRRFHYFYFDKQSLLLTAVDWNFFDSAVDLSYFDDYRQVQGFWMPFREKMSERLIKVVKNVEFNVNVDELFRESR
jgi:hypothetical protein